ncbi:MAG: tetratricopeptide repeat protein, partial [Bryobacteraceae bacterium]
SHSGDYGAAIEQSRKVLDLDPQFAQGNLSLGWAYEGQGRFREASAEFEKAVGSSGQATQPVAALAHAYARSGNRAAAIKLLRQLEERSLTRYVAPYELAVIHAGLGDRSKALEQIERAAEDRSMFLVWVHVDPRFRTLRQEPRFQAVLRRMKLISPSSP